MPRLRVPGGLQGDELGVDGRVDRSDGLRVELVELAQPPAAAPRCSGSRRRRSRAARAAAACAMPCPRYARISGAVSSGRRLRGGRPCPEGVHLLLHDLGALAAGAHEQAGVLEHRRRDLAVAGALEDRRARARPRDGARACAGSQSRVPRGDWKASLNGRGRRRGTGCGALPPEGRRGPVARVDRHVEPLTRRTGRGSTARARATTSPGSPCGRPSPRRSRRPRRPARRRPGRDPERQRGRGVSRHREHLDLEPGELQPLAAVEEDFRSYPSMCPAQNRGPDRGQKGWTPRHD